MTQLLTPRLRLEPFDDSHLAGLHALNSDPEVMRYLSGHPESLEETQAGIDRVKQRWKQWGYSWWSFFERSTGELVGAGCIQHLGKDQTQPLEIGWRLRRDRWGQGLASEAARRMARFAFDYLAAPDLTAVCVPENLNSAQVMQRLGMRLRGTEQWYGSDATVYGITAQEWTQSPACARALAEAVPEEDEWAAQAARDAQAAREQPRFL
ncbi:GNAT family N-acetyltransferase [Roseateles sp. SL47]|uniref:GNAT family N-acetyltransferase n=1 Tax=Roseateles sp. SL47 TaxID=2995138 RepID=UPI002D1E43DD|nr:GNAT family N-acetyltransferase [Roseateles sp. SL47]